MLRRVITESALSHHPPGQQAAVIVAYLRRGEAAEFLAPHAALDAPQACMDALILIRRAAELSEQAASWDLDDTCARYLQVITVTSRTPKYLAASICLHIIPQITNHMQARRSNFMTPPPTFLFKCHCHSCHFMVFPPKARCICRQAACEGCQNLKALTRLPDPCKTQCRWGRYLFYSTWLTENCLVV